MHSVKTLKELIIWCFSVENQIPMQYTWLKDKNWKEIYEGDIVKDWWNENRKWVVDFYEEWWYFDLNIWYIESQDCQARDCEIIGNKFENPELLK